MAGIGAVSAFRGVRAGEVVSQVAPEVPAEAVIGRVGGLIAGPGFALASGVSVVAGVAALVLSRGRGRGWVCTALIGAALTLGLVQGWMSASIRAASDAQWSLRVSGEQAEADALRDGLASFHKAAESVFGLSALLVAGALGCALLRREGVSVACPS